MSFSSVLEKHRKESFTQRDKGYRFEKLIQGFLKTDPLYKEVLANVWLWNEFPYADQFGNSDVGIDLVAVTKANEFWAIQCKCYAEDTTISKGDVDSFLATSSKNFIADDLGRVNFSKRYWISTTDKWGKNAEEALHNQSPSVTRLNYSELENAPVDWDKLDEGIFGDKARVEKHKIRQHQETAVEAVHKHFETEERGKLIMAC
ncbi:MAG: restriction endonuclease, partial [Methanomicrobium sp.]|nr:restriction endonuclease [Methanomicrobium sp.]